VRTNAIGETAKDLYRSFLATLKRAAMLYLNGGSEDTWAFAFVTKDVIDINTKMPVKGYVMRKVIDGKWVHRQMTEEERGDFDAGRAW
jgi:hypothetical protein